MAAERERDSVASAAVGGMAQCALVLEPDLQPLVGFRSHHGQAVVERV